MVRSFWAKRSLLSKSKKSEVQEENVTTVKEEKEDTKTNVKQEKKEKPKHHPKIVKVEPWPTPDSDQEDPYVQKFPKERKQQDKKPGKCQCQKCNDNFHTLHDHIGKHE